MIYSAYILDEDGGPELFATELFRCGITKGRYLARQQWPRGELRTVRLPDTSHHVTHSRCGRKYRAPILMHRGTSPQVIRSATARYGLSQLRELRKLKGVGRPILGVVSGVLVKSTG